MVLFWLFWFSGLVQAQLNTEYKLGSGDIISIFVYGEEDLSLEIQLTDSGTLSYPFLGEMQVVGITATQLREKITRGLRGDYLIDPKVSVQILQYRPFFINGEVVQPGSFSFQPGLTVRKAVTLAQGFTEKSSKKKNIYIISDTDPRQIPRRATLNSVIKPGDIVSIEPEKF